MNGDDPEVEVATTLTDTSATHIGEALITVLRDDGGPMVQDLLDAGAEVKSATVYADAVYATFTVDEGDYEEVRKVDRTDDDDEGEPNGNGPDPDGRGSL
jgi:hypothetical protein